MSLTDVQSKYFCRIVATDTGSSKISSTPWRWRSTDKRQKERTHTHSRVHTYKICRFKRLWNVQSCINILRRLFSWPARLFHHVLAEVLVGVMSDEFSRMLKYDDIQNGFRCKYFSIKMAQKLYNSNGHPHVKIDARAHMHTNRCTYLFTYFLVVHWLRLRWWSFCCIYWNTCGRRVDCMKFFPSMEIIPKWNISQSLPSTIHSRTCVNKKCS